MHPMNKEEQHAIARIENIDYAECPTCYKEAHSTDEVIELFGIRTMSSRHVRPQSYCYACRSLHARQQRELRKAIKEGFVELDESEFDTPGDLPYEAETSGKATERGRRYDYQREALYAAEQRCWREVSVKTPTKILDIAASAEFIAQKMLRSQWYADRVGIEPCKLEIKCDAGKWFYRPHERTIYLKRKAGNKVWIIIHEFAHHVDAVIEDLHATDEEPRNSFHGPQYAAIYLELVQEFLGKTAHKALRSAFEEDGIDVASWAE